MNSNRKYGGSAPVLEEVHREKNALTRASRGRWRVDGILTVIGWLAVVAFAVMTVVPGLSGSQVFAGTDLLAQWAPWNSVTDESSVTNGGISDTIDSVIPSEILIAESADEGFFAQWDPYNAGGVEALALPNSAMLSPLSLPWWVLPESMAPVAVKLMEIAAVALGMFLLLKKRWGLPGFAPPIATLVFISSGFMIAWTNWPQTRVAAFIPLLFWATDRLAVERKLRDVLSIGVVLSCMLLGGFPAVVAYSLYAAIAYFFVRTIAMKQGFKTICASFFRSGCGVALGIALAAIQILPFAWFTTHYVDFEARSGSGILDSRVLASVVVPGILGYPDGSSSTWPIHFVEGFSYIGAAAFALLLAALVIRRKEGFPAGTFWYFTAGLVFVGIAVYYGGLPFELLQYLPGISGNPVGRMRSILGFFAAILVAFGAAALFQPKRLHVQLALPETRRVRWVISGLLAALIAVTMLGLISFKIYTSDRTVASIRISVLVSMAIMVVIGVVGLLSVLSRRAIWRTMVPIVSSIGILLPAVSVAQSWWPLSDADTFYPETSTHSYLQENLGQDRYASVDRTMSPATSSAYQLRSLTGHGFSSPQWRETMTLIDPDFYLTQTFSTLSSANLAESLQSPVLDRFGVKYVTLDPDTVPPGTVEDVATEADGETSLTESTSALKTKEQTGPVRAIILHISDVASASVDGAEIAVTIVSDDGSTLAATTREVSGADDQFVVALSGDAISEDQAWHAEVSVQSGSATVTMVSSKTGDVEFSLVRPADDNLQVVHTGDTTILERMTALSRIRWSSSEVVVSNSAERLSALKEGTYSGETVILEHAEDARNVDGSSSATVESRDIDTNTIEISVQSSGAGWVTISDPMRDNGWSATIDGVATELTDADNAAVAVYVASAGQHTIVLQYRPPYFTAGAYISGCAVLIVVASLLVLAIRKIRGRQPRLQATEISANSEIGEGEQAFDESEKPTA